MSAIRKSLLQLMFSGSYMRRWNDKLRPVELYEIDKQAHKMIVAWMLTLLNSGGYSASDQLKLQQEVIERGLLIICTVWSQLTSSPRILPYL